MTVFMFNTKLAILALSLLLTVPGLTGVKAAPAAIQNNLSASIEEMEGYAEDIVETANRPNWATINQKTVGLRRRWQVNYPVLKKKSDRTDLIAFELSLLDLEQAVRQRSVWLAAHSANTLTLALIDFQTVLPPGKVPVAVAEMDYWGREVALRSQVGRWDSTLVGIQQLKSLWQELRPRVQVHDVPLTRKVDASTVALALAVNRQSRQATQAYTSLILEQVDGLENLFNRL